MNTDAGRTRWTELAIWVWAFGYFACYAPYGAMPPVLQARARRAAQPAVDLDLTPR